jgi:hypothetical protein
MASVVEVRRSILLSTRIRTSAVGATARDLALDQIVEQNLATAPRGQGLDENEVSQVATVGSHRMWLRPADVWASLKRLQDSGRVLASKGPHARVFTLSEAAHADVEGAIRVSDQRVANVLSQAFGVPGVSAAFRQAFLSVVCEVFGALGDMYVRGLAQPEIATEFAGHQVLSAALDKALVGLPPSDHTRFKLGTIRFFSQSTPEFDAVKWNMAQNHYLLRILGLDAGANLLSDEILRDSTLLLDTNVLVAALSPGHRHFQSVRILGDAFRHLNVDVVVAGITARELRALLARTSTQLRELLNRVPKAMLGDVAGFLLGSFLAAKEEQPDLELEDFLTPFQAPFIHLESVIAIRHIDDAWFEREEQAKPTLSLARRLSEAYRQRRGRPKTDAAALHDALLLRWLARQSNLSGNRQRLLTLDASLPGFRAEEMGEAVAPVVSLDALLQWAGALGVGSSDQDGLASLYAQAIAFEFFPKRALFTLEDFRVFADMDIETAQLPPEDVEACIEEVHRLSPELDPSRPQDREKIQAAVQRHLSNPGRTYKREIDRLGKEKLEEATRRAAAEQRAGDAEAREAEAKEAAQDRAAALQNAEARIRALEEDAQKRAEGVERRKETRSALGRLALPTGALLLLWVVTAKLALELGEGATWFVKLTNAWGWFTGEVVAIGASVPFILGKNGRAVIKRWRGSHE